ncbi:MAG: hypothetical protein L6R39_005946, partial [Caloplaca ligustica]
MSGVVTITFSRPESAAKALESLNGMKVDGRPMKIEVVLDAAKAVAAVPLSERIKPGKGPKPATAEKATTNGTATRGGGAARGRASRRGRNAGRTKAKTADELDAEMVDYFDNTSNATGATAAQGTDAAAGVTTNGTAQPAANLEDAGMDEIS